MAAALITNHQRGAFGRTDARPRAVTDGRATRADPPGRMAKRRPERRASLPWNLLLLLLAVLLAAAAAHLAHVRKEKEMAARWSGPAHTARMLDRDGAALVPGAVEEGVCKRLLAEVTPGEAGKKKKYAAGDNRPVLAPEKRTHVTLKPAVAVLLLKEVLGDDRVRGALASSLARSAHAASSEHDGEPRAEVAYLVEAGALITYPGAKAQPLHQDTATTEDVSACVDDATGRIDARCFDARIVTVQLYLRTTSGMAPLEVVVGGARIRPIGAVNAPCSAVLFDSRTVHRGGAHNGSPMTPRAVAYFSLMSVEGARPAGGTYACDPAIFERMIPLDRSINESAWDLATAPLRHPNPFDRGEPAVPVARGSPVDLDAVRRARHATPPAP